MPDLWTKVLPAACLVLAFAWWARAKRRREMMTPPKDGRVFYHDGPMISELHFSHPDALVDYILWTAKRLANARRIPNPEKQT